MTEYQVINPSHPFWPLTVSQVLSANRRGDYPPRFERWMTRHLHFLMRGAGFVPAIAQPTDSTPEAA